MRCSCRSSSSLSFGAPPSRHQPDQRQNKGNIELFKLQYLRRILCHFSCDSSNFSSDKPFDWIFTSEIVGELTSRCSSSHFFSRPPQLAHSSRPHISHHSPLDHSTTHNYELRRDYHGEDYISNQKDCCEKGNRDNGEANKKEH